MSLSPGTRLGPYEVIAPIGAGGMGEVYRARDTKLNRDVAIKVLPELFAGDPDRLARFTREAQTLATLNHPNIAAVYGLEANALVMELVPGEDLSALMARGPIALDDALPIARQIAAALEAAHEHGIIHRDLKPANIKVRDDGAVKVLDFGLAKAMLDVGAGFSPPGDGPAKAGPYDSPTVTAMTQMGMILGTAAYMAPEQARGKVVDKRADIWAFGVVVFEMLTGRRAFDGEEISDVLAAVLRQDIDWTRLPASTPPRLRRLLERCLERDVKLRLRDIGEARVELARVGAPGEAAPAAADAPPPSRSSWLPWGVAALLAIVAAGLGWRAFTARTAPAVASMHLRLNLDPATALLGSDPNEVRVGSRRPRSTAFVFSPDGRRLVFAGEQGGTQQLYVRDLSRDAAVAIVGTTGGDTPFFSPDGRWIGFWANGALRKVPAEGGPATEICKTTDHISRALWGLDDVIVFSAGSLSKVAASGGAPTSVTTINAEAGETYHVLSSLLPDGRVMFAVGVGRGMAGAHLAVQSIGGGDRKTVVENATDGRYLPSGYLVFMRDATLMAAPFDPKTLTLTAGAVSVLDDVMVSRNAPNANLEMGEGQFAVSDTGSLAYLTGGMYLDSASRLVWVNSQGKLDVLNMDERAYLAPRLSPNGQQVVMYTNGLDRALWIYDLAKSTASKLPFDGEAAWGMWTPDGKRIVFAGSKTGRPALHWIAADGRGGAERLSTTNLSQAPASWSGDGSELVFLEVHPDTGYDIYAMSMANRSTRPLVQTRATEIHPAVSPDGKWLAYASDEAGGRMEVFVQPYAGGARAQVSIGGGMQSRWSRDSRELIYAKPIGTEQQAIMSVSIGAGVPVTAGMPRQITVLTIKEFGASTPLGNFDIAADGRLLGATRDRRTTPPTPFINIITNWLDELRAKAPGGR